MNHTSGPHDVTAVLDWFAQAERPTQAGTALLPAQPDRHPDVRNGWAQGGDFDEQTVRGLPLFTALEQNELEIVASSPRELRAERGEAVIHRWHGTRHFYTIVAGTVAVFGDGGMRELGPGDFFVASWPHSTGAPASDTRAQPP